MDWISVKKRLPEDNKSVLVHIKNDEYILIAHIYQNVWTPDTYLNEYCFLYGDAYCETENLSEKNYTEVTHWMPLPEPPKE